MRQSILRGDIRPCLLERAVGCEIGRIPKFRPVVVVSSNRQNGDPRNQIVIVVPLTSLSAGRSARCDEVLIRPVESGLQNRSVTVCNQVGSVDRLRVGRRIGRVSAATMAEISRRLKDVLGLEV